MAARPATMATIDLGTIRVTYLPDGMSRTRPADQFVGGTEAMWAAHPELLDEDGWLVMGFGAYLLESAGRLALIDLGWGPSTLDLTAMSDGVVEGDATGGALIENLNARGVRPGDIDTVLFTHLHPDHIGWVRTSAGTTFPHAVNVIAEPEWEYWRGPGTANDLGPAPEAMADFEAHLRTCTDGDFPFPGVILQLTPGHTPGHAAFVLTGAERRMIVVGDSLHCPLELYFPELDFANDVDPGQARLSCARIVEELSRPGTLVAAGHFPDPAFQRLRGTSPPDLRPAGVPG